MSNKKPDGRICLESVKPCCASHAQSLMRGVRSARLQTQKLETPDVKEHSNENNKTAAHLPSKSESAPFRREKVILYSPEDFNKKLFIWLTYIAVVVVSLVAIGACVIIDINGKSTESLLEILKMIFALFASIITFGVGFLLGNQSKSSTNAANAQSAHNYP